MSLPPGIRLDDPRAYCGRRLDIVAQGCGSQEIREPDRFCRIAAWVARQRVASKE